MGSAVATVTVGGVGGIDLPGLVRSLDRYPYGCAEQITSRALPLVYLDSANTSQKPQVVIDTMVDHLERHNANVARAMHQLGAEASEAFEGPAPLGEQPRPVERQPLVDRALDRL